MQMFSLQAYFYWSNKEALHLLAHKALSEIN